MLMLYKKEENMRKHIIKLLAVVSCISITTFSLIGCGETKTADIHEVYEAVKEAYGEEYIPSYEFDAEYVQEIFGLSEDLYEDIIAEGPKVSFNIDTFVAVKAVQGKGDQVYDILSDYRDTQINDAMQYPTNAIKIQASEVTKYGDYIFFTCLGVIPEDIEDNGDEAILEEAKSDNKIAVDVIESFFK